MGNTNIFEMAGMNPFIMFGIMVSIGSKYAENALQNEVVQELLKSEEKFDVVIVENFIVDALVGFGQHFNCPVIALNTFDGIYWNDIFTGNESPLSYVPSTFLDLPERMSFRERLWNTFFAGFEKLIYNFYNLPIQRKLYEKYFPNATQPFYEVHKNVSIMFTNSHVGTSSARPLLPNMIGINGIHIEPAKPLPSEIKQFLDSATEGVILFSMGSIVLGTDWPLTQREAFVRTFGRIKQKVLWKYENETLPGKPDNVKISSWLPQRDVVAHPNVKLFITHGGSLGTTESLSEGVPLLVIPLYGDQHVNMKRAVAKGYALSLNFGNITEENFSETVNELLTNPIYDENAKRISKIFRDRPMDPKQTVVYWTEHVIRHQGADYLKATARRLSFVEFYLIDVYITLFAGVLLTSYVFIKIIRLIMNKSLAKKQKTQ